jgi:hypothetical protein
LESWEGWDAVLADLQNLGDRMMRLNYRRGTHVKGFIETHTGSAIEHPEPEIEKR